MTRRACILPPSPRRWRVRRLGRGIVLVMFMGIFALAGASAGCAALDALLPGASTIGARVFAMAVEDARRASGKAHEDPEVQALRAKVDELEKAERLDEAERKKAKADRKKLVQLAKEVAALRAELDKAIDRVKSLEISDAGVADATTGDR